MRTTTSTDRFAAEWLRQLIKAGLIADGEVDERDIQHVQSEELRRFTQCHFFAGIAVWSYALRAAGWSDDSPVWTGSCPCQGFSASGQRGGFSDKRHLWPAWFRLIAECRPHTIFGEQVASKDGLAWLDVVSADMEGAGYAIGAADLCASGFGAPHIRQRLYFVADSKSTTFAGWSEPGNCNGRNQAEWARAGSSAGRCSGTRGMEHANGSIENKRASIGEQSLCGEREAIGFWSGAEWIECGDGKSRPIEPGTFPLAHGVAYRMEQVRGYGNSLVSEVAKGFIEAYREVTEFPTQPCTDEVASGVE